MRLSFTPISKTEYSKKSKPEKDDIFPFFYDKRYKHG